MGHCALSARLLGCASSFALLFGVIGSPAWAAEYKAGLKQINLTSAMHQEISDGSGVIIGILDTLVDYRHLEFGDRLNREDTGRFADSTHTVFDDHGTHVAGILGAAVNGRGLAGVAPNASLVNFAMFDDDGWAAGTRSGEAVAWIVERGATVVNMSYGSLESGKTFLGTGELSMLASYNDELVIARAAMNHGMNLKSQPLPSGVGVADLDHILIVGSVNGDNGISSFSNRPGQACWGTTSTTCSETSKMMYSFIVAPGDRKFSTLPGNDWGSMSGTSMATPHVAGAAALLQSAWPHLKDDPGATVDILKQSAKDLGASGVDAVYGWGLLDVGRSLQPIGSTYVASTGSVSGGGSSLSDSSLALSAAVPGAASVENAVDGLVVFDDFGRDFEVGLSFVDETDDAELMADRLSALGHALGARRGSFALASLSASFSATGGTGDGGYTEFALAEPGRGLTLGFGDALGGAAALSLGRAAGAEAQLRQSLAFGLGPAGEDLDQGFYASGSLSLAPGLALSAFYNESSRAPTDPAADPATLLRDEEEEDQSRLMAVQLSYQPLDGVIFGASYTRLEESDGLLGSDGEGAFALAGDGSTDMAGLSLAVDLDSNLRLFAFYQEAWSNGEAADGSVFGAVDDWRSRRFGVALGVDGAFESGDWLELSLVRPLAIYSGSGEAEVPVGRTADGAVVYESSNYDLASDAVPLELNATYLGAGGEWAPGRSFDYGVSVNWRADDATAGVADSALGVLFAVKAEF